MSRLLPLHAVQRLAAAPDRNAWVSASAGAGKTQVLTARVLRLLLGGASPEGILCLTYTRAAAAEMQNRIFGRLARWVRADDDDLARDLEALGCTATSGLLAEARRLFARALEARGGLRVQTLHSFAQSVLASFPIEAGVPPGFEILDERTSRQLGREVMAVVLARAEAGGDQALLADVATLSVGLGEAKLAEVLRAVSRAHAALASLGTPSGYEAALRAWLGLPRDGRAEDILAAALADGAFDCASLRRFAALLAEHGSATGSRRASVLIAWLECDAAGRCRSLEQAASVFTTGEGVLNSRLVVKAMRTADNGCDELARALYESFRCVVRLQAGLELAARAAASLRVGAVLADAGRAAKARAGGLDFDDVIAGARALLGRPGLSDWVRYKLDQRIEHILLDEGQDTNRAQWSIIEALAEEFYAGEGRTSAPRTMFAVGDFKQAIFGFQGSEPRLFEEARDRYRALAEGAALPFESLDLARNFRSAPAILRVVDTLLDQLGHTSLGVGRPVPCHEPERAGQPGLVALWPAVVPDEQARQVAVDAGLPWMPSAEVREARLLARQIRLWLDRALHVGSRGRPLSAGDVLVLVRKRSEFVGALVAALHEAGVAVAGVDRLKLTEPLAVQDLLALVRFALQPNDDLTLAVLLVSPFIGWSQEELLALAQPRRGTLWQALREAAEAGDARVAEARRWLDHVLARADIAAPYQLLEEVLSGPLGGRARLLERLGGEARDAIEELLTQALVYQSRHTPTLSGFLDWLGGEEVDVRRDPDTQPDAVRIMTVHGAKGLQAPVVILADAARAGETRAMQHVLAEVPPADEPVPIFFGGQAGRLGPIETKAAEQEQLERQEDLRLLYVALTRAEDMLFVGGALGQRQAKRGGAADGSWHHCVEAALTALGAAEEDDPLWGQRRVYGDAVELADWLAGPEATAPQPAGAEPAPEPVGAEPVAAETADAASRPSPRVPTSIELPAWTMTAPAAEQAPPRPLSPSRLGADDLVTPPSVPGGGAAALRGRLLHRLFEQLPVVPPADRRAAALGQLARQGSVLSSAEQEEIVASALRVLDDPRFADVFAPGALAEAPLAAVVGTTIIAGTVDRLLVEHARVLVVDYKTGRHVPDTATEVPPYYLRQMAAYVAALRCIFPKREIVAGLLFTEGPRLIMLPDASMARHAPAS